MSTFNIIIIIIIVSLAVGLYCLLRQTNRMVTVIVRLPDKFNVDPRWVQDCPQASFS